MFLVSHKVKFLINHGPMDYDNLNVTLSREMVGS